MAIENTVSSDFDPHCSLLSVFSIGAYPMRISSL